MQRVTVTFGVVTWQSGRATLHPWGWVILLLATAHTVRAGQCIAPGHVLKCVWPLFMHYSWHATCPLSACLQAQGMVMLLRMSSHFSVLLLGLHELLTLQRLCLFGWDREQFVLPGQSGVVEGSVHRIRHGTPRLSGCLAGTAWCCGRQFALAWHSLKARNRFTSRCRHSASSAWAGWRLRCAGQRQHTIVSVAGIACALHVQELASLLHGPCILAPDFAGCVLAVGGLNCLLWVTSMGCGWQGPFAFAVNQN